jgi:ABC-type enterochelin transport system substrate-binding protein
MVKRMAVVALVGLSLVAMGCSSSKSQDAAATTSTTASTGSGSVTTAAGNTATTKASSGTGDVAAFCAAFTSLDSLGAAAATNSGSDVANTLKDSAQKLRDNAPADLTESANAYADLLDAAAASLSGANSQAAMAQAMGQLGGARTGQAIVPVVTFAATNCQLG